MTITILYPSNGKSRTHRNMTQRQVNVLITRLSDLNDSFQDNPVPVHITVQDDIQ